MNPPDPPISYKRSRFSTRLPTDRLYTPSHFWMLEESAVLYRVGFTRFATRMLGDLVEFGFDRKIGEAVAVGDAIGWVEGFKAITDLYCVAAGTFEGSNVELEQDVTLTDSDCYGKGWLYRVRGRPDANAVDVRGYIAMLDLTIDKMQEKEGEAPRSEDVGGGEEGKRC